MYRIKNTAEDRTKHLLHRTAAKFELEPTLGGVRIRLGSFIDITDEHYARVKPIVDEWVSKGMVEVFPVLPDGIDIRKYAAPLPEEDLERIKKEMAEMAATAIKEELNRPSTMSQVMPAIPIEEPVAPSVAEPTVVVEPEPVPVIPPVVQAPPPPPAFNKPQAQDQNKNKKLR